jgi:hypothetical protein
MPRLLLAALALSAATACTPRVVVPDAERERTRAALDGQTRYLRSAMSVHPLFGDKGKALLLDAPAAEVDLLRSAGGDVIPPPPAEKILPPGTPVRVQEVEFPTAMSIASRVVMTPRYHPWALLQVGGDPRPNVLVLSQTAATAEEVLLEVDRVLTVDDPSPFLRSLPAEQRDAVLKKALVEGMSTRAVELAWGLPEKKRIDRPSGAESWTWAGGLRHASFQDDKLVRWERERPSAAAP